MDRNAYFPTNMRQRQSGNVFLTSGRGTTATTDRDTGNCLGQGFLRARFGETFGFTQGMDLLAQIFVGTQGLVIDVIGTQCSLYRLCHVQLWKPACNIFVFMRQIHGAEDCGNVFLGDLKGLIERKHGAEPWGKSVWPLYGMGAEAARLSS